MRHAFVHTDKNGSRIQLIVQDGERQISRQHFKFDGYVTVTAENKWIFTKVEGSDTKTMLGIVGEPYEKEGHTVLVVPMEDPDPSLAEQVWQDREYEHDLPD